MAQYYLFLVMYDDYPQSWEAMVKNCVAAQDYFPGIACYNVNINELRRLIKGDIVVAAFKDYRFAGYGTLTSGFRQVPPISEDPFHGMTSGGFPQRFDCDWTVIPQENNPPFVNCRYLKNRFSIGLRRVRCLKQIDQSTFVALRGQLDRAGARQVCSK